MNKTKSTILLSAFASLALFSACSDVKEDDRFVENPRAEVERNVLVFEFTGQGCPNCPGGAETIHNIQTQYPGHVIAVCLHPDGLQFTRPVGNPLGLVSSQATQLYEFYGRPDLPSAVVDGGTATSNTVEWPVKIKYDLEIAAPADIDVTITYTEADKKVKADYDVKFNHYMVGDINIQLFLVENDLVGWQNISGKWDREYVHNHVLRTAFYPELWGVNIGNLFNVEQTISDSAELTLEDSWVAENCEVVAFITGPDHSVLQVVSVPVIAKKTEE